MTSTNPGRMDILTRHCSARVVSLSSLQDHGVVDQTRLSGRWLIICTAPQQKHCLFWGSPRFGLKGEMEEEKLPLEQLRVAQCGASQNGVIDSPELLHPAPFQIAGFTERDHPKRHLQAGGHECSATGAFVALNKPPSRYERQRQLLCKPRRELRGLGRAGRGPTRLQGPARPDSFGLDWVRVIGSPRREGRESFPALALE